MAEVEITMTMRWCVLDDVTPGHIGAEDRRDLR